MRKIFTVILLVLSLVSSAQARPRLTVRAFDDKTEQHNAPSYAIADMMTTELNKAGVFDLLERERYDLINDEFLLVDRGMVDPETAPKRGQVISAQYIMTGAITMYYYDEKGAGLKVSSKAGLKTQKKTAYVVLDLRIFDSQSNVVYSAVQTGTAKHSINEFNVDVGSFSAGIYSKREGGILAAAARDAIVKHVREIEKTNWE